MEKKARHIGIILDGNRRYAKKRAMQPWKGHELGFEKLKKLFEWCSELDIKELTLYCFSMQNFNRPKIEVDKLMNIFVRAGNEAAVDENVHKHKIKLRAVGRTHLFPQEVQDALKKVEEATKDYGQYTINLALAYGGRSELVDAATKLAKDVKEGKVQLENINEETFSSYLYLDSDPDIIIRTGGAHRTSNFLPWQSVYSEWFFPVKFWPEFEKEDLQQIINEFENKRERRFGK